MDLVARNWRIWQLTTGNCFSKIIDPSGPPPSAALALGGMRSAEHFRPPPRIRHTRPHVAECMERRPSLSVKSVTEVRDRLAKRDGDLGRAERAPDSAGRRSRERRAEALGHPLDSAVTSVPIREPANENGKNSDFLLDLL